MALQTSKYLVKCYNQALSGQAISGSSKYLEDLIQGKFSRAWQVNNAEDLRNPALQLEAFRFAAARKVQLCVEQLEQAKR